MLDPKLHFGLSTSRNAAKASVVDGGRNRYAWVVNPNRDSLKRRTASVLNNQPAPLIRQKWVFLPSLWPKTGIFDRNLADLLGREHKGVVKNDGVVGAKGKNLGVGKSDLRRG